ncbi:MAG: acetyl-CoA carboxylase biotin carboxyl carrier protein [Taibaiella sp.]|nr:acetyl-CoA carboxylase biotin carboxyl carrier protein [Taibaiella sp.]
MEYKQIQELIKVINKSNIETLKIKDGEFEITIKQQSNQEAQIVTYAPPPAMPVMQAAPVAPAAAPPAPAAEAPKAAEAAPAHTITIKSPMIGTFYRSSSPDKPAFVSVGDEVTTGKVVCIIEAMKLFNEIESEVSGKIVKVLVDDATPVEYDQPLFLVEP